MVTLVEFMVNGEGSFGCVSETDGGEHVRAMGVALLVMFMFLGLLLTNVLIAQLAKRFDEFWESQEVNYMFIRVQAPCVPMAPGVLDLLHSLHLEVDYASFTHYTW
jgi:hypothetical protein